MPKNGWYFGVSYAQRVVETILRLSAIQDDERVAGCAARRVLGLGAELPEDVISPRARVCLVAKMGHHSVGHPLDCVSFLPCLHGMGHCDSTGLPKFYGWHIEQRREDLRGLTYSDDHRGLIEKIDQPPQLAEPDIDNSELHAIVRGACFRKNNDLH